MAHILRTDGHEVDPIWDGSSERYVFNWGQITDIKEDLSCCDAISFLDDPRTQRAFKEDKEWIDWADALLMLLPCGNSSHLEAGYASGSGKLLYIFGDFQKGSFDVMYGFANALFRITQLEELRKTLKTASILHAKIAGIKDNETKTIDSKN